MPGSILGNRVVRKEDPKFLTTGGMYLDDLHDVPELAGAAHVAYVRSTVAHGTITSIDSADAPRHARRRRACYTAADLGLQPVAVAVQPRRRPARCWPATGSATSASRSPPSSPRRRRQAADAAEAVVVDYDLLEVLVDPEAARRRRRRCSTTPPAATSCSTRRRSASPDLTGDEYFADCEVTVSGTVRQPARRPVPARGARLGGGVGRRPAAPVGVDAARAGHPRRRSSPANGVEPAEVRVDHARRRRRLRRQDRRVPRGDCCSAASPRRSAGRCAGPRPAASRWWRSATGGPRSSTSPSAARRDGKVTHYRLHVLQDCGAFAEIGADPGPVHDPADVVGRVRHPEHRVPHHVGASPTPRPIVAYRGAGRPEATAAVERAMDLFAARDRAWTRPTCAGST